jgi:hypothetical protein
MKKKLLLPPPKLNEYDSKKRKMRGNEWLKKIG